MNRRGKGRSILVVTKSRIGQFSLVTPLNSLSFSRLILPPFPLKARRLPPPPTRKTRSPLHPSFQAKNGDLFLTSGLRFSENEKFYDLFPFLITFPFS